MEINIAQIDFTVAINSLSDEIMQKMQILTNMQIELLRKFQHQICNSDTHFRMIHDVRCMLVNLEEVYKDVRDYFTQIHSEFIYDFFRKIHLLMVCGYNFLSQALLITVSKQGQQKNVQQPSGQLLQCKQCKCTCSKSKKRKQLSRDVQQFDFRISSLQNEEDRLSHQIHHLHEKMMNQRGLIERTKPSLVIRQLEDMKEHIENTLESTNSVFEDSYQMKYVQFKNYLKQIKKPEDVVSHFIANMNSAMKDKFIQLMTKAVHKVHLPPQQTKHQQTQTDAVTKVRQEKSSFLNQLSRGTKASDQNSLKERKANEKNLSEIQSLKKQIAALTKQNSKLKKQIQEKKQNSGSVQQDYETLKKLYSKQGNEIQKIRSEKQWLISEKQSETKVLKAKIKLLESNKIEKVDFQCQAQIKKSMQAYGIQTEEVDNQINKDKETIKVLKGNQQIMIKHLNQTQKKIREYKVELTSMQELKRIKKRTCQFLQKLWTVLNMAQENFLNQSSQNAIATAECTNPVKKDLLSQFSQIDEKMSKIQMSILKSKNHRSQPKQQSNSTDRKVKFATKDKSEFSSSQFNIQKGFRDAVPTRKANRSYKTINLSGGGQISSRANYLNCLQTKQYGLQTDTFKRVSHRQNNPIEILSQNNQNILEKFNFLENTDGLNLGFQTCICQKDCNNNVVQLSQADVQTDLVYFSQSNKNSNFMVNDTENQQIGFDQSSIANSNRSVSSRNQQQQGYRNRTKGKPYVKQPKRIATLSSKQFDLSQSGLAKMNCTQQQNNFLDKNSTNFQQQYKKQAIASGGVCGNGSAFTGRRAYKQNTIAAKLSRKFSDVWTGGNMATLSKVDPSVVTKKQNNGYEKRSNQVNVFEDNTRLNKYTDSTSIGNGVGMKQRGYNNTQDFQRFMPQQNQGEAYRRALRKKSAYKGGTPQKVSYNDALSKYAINFQKQEKQNNICASSTKLQHKVASPNTSNHKIAQTKYQASSYVPQPKSQQRLLGVIKLGPIQKPQTDRKDECIFNKQVKMMLINQSKQDLKQKIELIYNELLRQNEQRNQNFKKNKNSAYQKNMTPSSTPRRNDTRKKTRIM